MPSSTAALWRSDIVDKLPWHFAGEIFYVEFESQEFVGSGRVLDGLELAYDASEPAGFVFAAWQFWSDDGAQLQDPVLGQFHEAFVVLPCLYGGVPVSYCPLMWVTTGASMVRGSLQGLPKTEGAIHMTRPLRLGRGPRLASGALVAGTLSAGEQRLAAASMNLDAERPGPPPLFLRPMVNTRRIPLLPGSIEGSHQSVCTTLTDVEWTNCWQGTASLTVVNAPNLASVGLLRPEASRGYWFDYSETILGVTAAVGHLAPPP